MISTFYKNHLKKLIVISSPIDFAPLINSILLIIKPLIKPFIEILKQNQAWLAKFLLNKIKKIWNNRCFL